MSKVTDANRHPALTKIKYSEKTAEQIEAKKKSTKPQQSVRGLKTKFKSKSKRVVTLKSKKPTVAKKPVATKKTEAKKVQPKKVVAKTSKAKK